MFAPRHHAAMKHVVPVRKELAVRTIFNFLGPLTNPAGATRQLLGVSDRRYQETIAEALLALGCERALVVSAEDGLDELSISGPTRVVEVAAGATKEWFVDSCRCRPGRDPARRDLRRHVRTRMPRSWKAVLDGHEGPARDVVVLNAGAAILAGGSATDLGDGMDRAREAIDRGAAKGVLDKLRSLASPTRMSRLDELVDAARHSVNERSRAVPMEELRRASRRAPRIAPSRRRSFAPASR